MPTTPRILDAKGRVLEVGSRVADGGDAIGVVTEIVENDGHWAVETHWPAEPPVGPCDERFYTTPWNYRREGPEPSNWCTPDLTLITDDEKGDGNGTTDA